MTDSRGCEHEGTKVETASNRLNWVADPEGATASTYARTVVLDPIVRVSVLFLVVKRYDKIRSSLAASSLSGPKTLVAQ